ncbi:YlaH-like family protein [Brevibacillus marinus]|uniref:YlaH-like family protein n=1 Tax=Brevibacillus marinus TaxID=2496837 RepID=UPI000F841B27|nr:YlaH-like family protein [Brevibacillus marinus]
MEWFVWASTYEPPNPAQLSLYDQFREWADDLRYPIIFVCLLIVYYLGFAPRLRMPLLKTLLLYVLLALGALVFSILDTTLPVKAALVTAIVLLLIIRLRNKPRAD